MSGGLVRDLPDAVDPKQRVNVNPRFRRVGGIVEPEEDARHIRVYFKLLRELGGF